MASPLPRPRSGAVHPVVFLILLVVLLGLVALVPASQVRAQDQVAGHWEGEIQVPGNTLQIKVDLSNEEGTWRGRIDIPAQAAVGLRLSGFTVTADSVYFAIANVQGDPTFAGVIGEGRIEGSFRQSGMRFPFWLGREALAGPPRPQTPEPPFPYDAEEVTYENGEITLAGTLTLPRGAGPFPAALLITGSGGQDRDEALFDHKPFLVLADHLSRHGIAVLRVDDRGVGGSSAGPPTATSEDFASDVLRGVAFLAARPEVDPARIGLIGHSEGGLIAALAAARSEAVAFIVMMAGPGVSGFEVLPEQLGAMARARGARDDYLTRQREIQVRALQAVISDAPADTIRARVRELVRFQLPTGDEEAIERGTAAEVYRLGLPWYRFFLTHDPADDLRRVQVPVLALNGGKDLQVVADQNLPRIEAALREGGNPDYTIRRFEGLNHLFQPAETGLVEEYVRIEITVAPEVLETISTWIQERFGG